ncbi:AMP-binding protein [Brumicola blandensis]|jgi:acyl-CoA synthetase (AMP-forming)/AMP-acid ligase II|uniref:AMP-binding protein n=1 Tax=Brumicola blandensis TaxID=3075611 RepID=A0AAW8R6L4_9ALTE|nr:AMP-binding protein [Alteromonas sp. W409]MDT0582823.1 AMP-binding protein [Alteromonas sp. W409]
MTYFYQNLKQFGDSIALIQGDAELSYSGLAKQVEERALAIQNAVEQSMSDMGLNGSEADQPPKRLVGMIADNSVASVVNYLALLSQNYAILFISEAQLETHQKNVDKAHNRETQPLDVISAYQIRVVIHEETFHTLHPQSAKDNSDTQTMLPSIQDNVALLLSTSGSTGTSKQVVLSYDNLQANCDSICAYLPIEKSDVTITTLPFNYSYGLSIINTHLAVGASIVLTSLSVMQREFWQTFERHAVTSFGGVPHSYEMLLRLKFTSMALPSLKYFTQAGGKLSPDRVKQLASYASDNHKSFFVMYGQTEATARMAYADHIKLLAKPETIGKAIPNTRLRVEGDELVFTGENVMLGYANSCRDLASLPGVALLHTGDLAYEDDDGDFFITGRSKRIVKLFGERLSLDALQNSLQSALQRCADSHTLRNMIEHVFCVGDDKRLHIAVVVSSVAKQSDADIELILNTLKQYMRNLNIHASAMKYHIINETPLTSNGKVDYPGLLASLQSQQVASRSATGQAGEQS